MRPYTLAAALLVSLHLSAQAPAIVHPAFPSGADTPLGQQITALLASPSVSRAHWGVAVITLEGTPLFGLNEGQYFRPASNAKLFTTTTALALLGAKTQIKTTLLATVHTMAAPAASPDGTLDGDLLLQGSGDANLSARTFPYLSPAQRKAAAALSLDPLHDIDTMAATVAGAGIRHITGDIIGDDRLWPYEPYPDAWGLDDVIWGYGAPVSALSINDNQLELTVKPGGGAGTSGTASLSPDFGYYKLQVDVQTVDANQPSSVDVDRQPGSRTVHVYGRIPLGKPYATQLAIDDPPEFAAEALKAALRTHGVTVDGVARTLHQGPRNSPGFTVESHKPIANLPALYTEGVPIETTCFDSCRILASHPSPTLLDDLTLTLKVSQNLHAELLLHRLGKAYGAQDGSTAQGARVVRQYLLNAGLDGDDFVFYDGSGLSTHDLVTPRATAQLLSFATKQPWFPQWKAALPLGGEDGSLGARFKDAPLKDHVFAKTGTLGESRALSGYVDCASGKQVIFSIMVDTHSPATSADRTTMDKIVAAIAANN